jgi:hypothetical protein
MLIVLFALLCEKAVIACVDQRSELKSESDHTGRFHCYLERVDFLKQGCSNDKRKYLL